MPCLKLKYAFYFSYFSMSLTFCYLFSFHHFSLLPHSIHRPFPFNKNLTQISCYNNVFAFLFSSFTANATQSLVVVLVFFFMHSFIFSIQHCASNDYSYLINLFSHSILINNFAFSSLIYNFILSISFYFFYTFYFAFCIFFSVVLSYLSHNYLTPVLS